MAKPIKFGSSKPKKQANVSFNFGANVFSAKEKKAYQKTVRKATGKGGGS